MKKQSGHVEQAGHADASDAAPLRSDDPACLCFRKDFSASFNGVEIRYEAVAEEIWIRDDGGKPIASFFAIAYLQNDRPADGRPITFVFNGGPTSPAHWLHMGAFGPRRLSLEDATNGGAPPYTILDNVESPLSVTDLVFIDPVGTGYSRVLGDKKPADFWGLRTDASSVADFIAAWLTRYRRWNAPKYLAGESYGTTRAALVAENLTSRSIALNGIILISAVLDYQNSRPRPEDGAILPYVSFLPSMAAAAWYHGKTASAGKQTLSEYLDEVRIFARTDYACALIANARLSPAEFEVIAARVASYTGLSEDYVKRSWLRIPVNRFFKELLREQSLIIGRLDGRYTGIEADGAGELSEADPSLFGIAPAFNAAINAQLHALGVEIDQPYRLENLLDAEWDWRMTDRVPNGAGYVNVVPNLGRAMRRNKDLRVLVTLGHYDFSTPFFGAENALSQAGVVQDRITFKYYDVGHMIFLHEPSRIRFLDDVRSFISGGHSESSS